MSRPLGKPTICIGENKGADQLRGNREADQRLCFRYSDSTIPLLLNTKFQASSSFLSLYRPVYVGPVRKPHCWFSHQAAHIQYYLVHTACMKPQLLTLQLRALTSEPPGGKTNNVVFEQVRHKPTCTITEDG